MDDDLKKLSFFTGLKVEFRMEFINPMDGTESPYTASDLGDAHLRSN